MKYLKTYESLFQLNPTVEDLHRIWNNHFPETSPGTSIIFKRYDEYYSWLGNSYKEDINPKNITITPINKLKETVLLKNGNVYFTKNRDRLLGFNQEIRSTYPEIEEIYFYTKPYKTIRGIFKRQKGGLKWLF